MRDRFQAKDPRSWMLRIPHPDGWLHPHRAAAGEQRHSRDVGRRLGGGLGGTQSLHTNSMDEALALPTEHSVRVALRTQQIMATRAA
jgi:methylmalonyl-CoA mutase N-terminal domain/subunit